MRVVKNWLDDGALLIIHTDDKKTLVRHPDINDEMAESIVSCRDKYFLFTVDDDGPPPPPWPTDALEANPDFFTSMLWKRLMGSRVLRSSLGAAAVLVARRRHGAGSRRADSH